MKRFTQWVRLAVCVLLAITAAAQASPALAGDTAPQKWTTGSIERAYRNRMQDVRATTLWLKDANEYAAKVDMVIAELKGKGKDTRPLEQAVATFRSRIAGLEVDNAAVMTRLTVNSGFDTTGKVLNKGVAEQTVRDAKEMLGTISDYGDGAYVALHKAINDYYDHVAPYEFREPTRP